MLKINQEYLHITIIINRKSIYLLNKSILAELINIEPLDFCLLVDKFD